jgi:hypothetical protein
MHCFLSCLMNPPRCLDDVDDEVRDRAAMYLRMFKECLLADAYVKEGRSPDKFSTCNLAYRFSESVFSLDVLESKLVSYVNDPSASATPFDASSIPKISRAQAAADSARKLLLVSSPLFRNLTPTQGQAHSKLLVSQARRRSHPRHSYLRWRHSRHSSNNSRRSPSWRRMVKSWEVRSRPS